MHALFDLNMLYRYENAIAVIAKTLEPFDDDSLIPAVGFGDCEWDIYIDSGCDDMYVCMADCIPCCSWTG